jgi:hypothetical protein
MLKKEVKFIKPLVSYSAGKGCKNLNLFFAEEEEELE